MSKTDTLEIAWNFAHEAPGLLFGAYRREVAIRRFKQNQRKAIA